MFTNSDYAKDALCSLLKRDVKVISCFKGVTILREVAREKILKGLCVSVLHTLKRRTEKFPGGYLRIYF